MALGTTKLTVSTFQRLRGGMPRGQSWIAAMEGCGGRESVANTWSEDDM